MARSRFHPGVVVWCVAGLTLVQIDQFGATRGLLAQAWSHLSVLLILAWQILDTGREISLPLDGRLPGMSRGG